MGTYDTVHGIKIKSTNCEMKDYECGDIIDLPDGVHIGYEGWFVVKYCEIICVGEMVYDGYGCELIKEELMNARNPIARVVDETVREKDNDSVVKLLDSLKESAFSIGVTVNKIKTLIGKE